MRFTIRSLWYLLTIALTGAACTSTVEPPPDASADATPCDGGHASD